MGNISDKERSRIEAEMQRRKAALSQSPPASPLRVPSTDGFVDVDLGEPDKVPPNSPVHPSFYTRQVEEADITFCGLYTIPEGYNEEEEEDDIVVEGARVVHKAALVEEPKAEPAVDTKPEPVESLLVPLDESIVIAAESAAEATTTAVVSVEDLSSDDSCYSSSEEESESLPVVLPVAEEPPATPELVNERTMEPVESPEKTTDEPEPEDEETIVIPVPKQLNSLCESLLGSVSICIGGQKVDIQHSKIHDFVENRSDDNSNLDLYEADNEADNETDESRHGSIEETVSEADSDESNVMDEIKDIIRELDAGIEVPVDQHSDMVTEPGDPYIDVSIQTSGVDNPDVLPDIADLIKNDTFRAMDVDERPVPCMSTAIEDIILPGEEEMENTTISTRKIRVVNNSNCRIDVNIQSENDIIIEINSNFSTVE